MKHTPMQTYERWIGGVCGLSAYAAAWYVAVEQHRYGTGVVLAVVAFAVWLMALDRPH